MRTNSGNFPAPQPEILLMIQRNRFPTGTNLIQALGWKEGQRDPLEAGQPPGTRREDVLDRSLRPRRGGARPETAGRRPVQRGWG